MKSMLFKQMIYFLRRSCNEASDVGNVSAYKRDMAACARIQKASTTDVVGDVRVLQSKT